MLAQRVRREDRIAEVGGSYVLREELDVTAKVVLDDLPDAIGAEREFPVAGHHVDAEKLRGVDHVLAVCPQCRRRTLPAVAAVEQQCAGTAGFEPLDERRQVREAAGLPVAPRLRERNRGA